MPKISHHLATLIILQSTTLAKPATSTLNSPTSAQVTTATEKQPIVFDPSDLTLPVTLLNTENFKEKVLNSPDFWIVFWYLPTCYRSRMVAETFKKAASRSTSAANFGAVNAWENYWLAGEVGVKLGDRWPMILFFGHDKTKSWHFSKEIQGYSTSVEDILGEVEENLSNYELEKVKIAVKTTEIPRESVIQVEENGSGEATTKQPIDPIGPAGLFVTEEPHTMETPEPTASLLEVTNGPEKTPIGQRDPPIPEILEVKSAKKSMRGLFSLDRLDDNLANLDKSGVVTEIPDEMLETTPAGMTWPEQTATFQYKATKSVSRVDYANTEATTNEPVKTTTETTTVITTKKAVSESLFPDQIQRLTLQNYDELVKNTDDFWMVIFYLPGSLRAKALAPKLAEAAKLLAPFLKVGVIDGHADQELLVREEIYVGAKWPAIRFFGTERGEHWEYPEQLHFHYTSVGDVARVAKAEHLKEQNRQFEREMLLFAGL